MSLEAWGDDGDDDGYRHIDTLIGEGWISPDEVSQAFRDVLDERIRQQSAEGWTPAHDDTHKEGELADAAAAYAWAAGLDKYVRETAESGSQEEWFRLSVMKRLWPWDRKWWKPTDRRRDLVNAGALILAEIERLDRAGAVLAAERAKS